MQAIADSHDPSAAKPPRVLVVDDDPEIGALLSRYLQAQGLQVRIAGDGARLRAAMRAPDFDVVLLDLGLPDEDGLTLMRELRARWSGPVIIVSGRGESVERVVGLELGADDYVSKPFDLRELLARIRSVLRRAQPAVATYEPEEAALVFDGLRLHPGTRRLTGRDGAEIVLTEGEFRLLQVLLDRPRQVLSRDQLMTAMHGREAGPFDRAIDVQVGRLRRKIELDPSRPQLIRSVRGAGYLFAATVQRG
ncbi:response regulator [Vulcaniibacterium gelatinicum]|uniref:response regulator n=1 Tax=Vulcaniibacterium gelatinicum TaxID=2598725 RepID=UPI0011C776F4|nr:response regulator transcription factor [Vulcaniibacterium gelatinicum]